MTGTAEKGGRFAYEGLDRLLHEKARLSIMASLYTWKKGHSFNKLKELCNLTDGNLSRHISILKEADMVRVTKAYEKNKPITSCQLTENGRKRFRAYLDELEQIVKDAQATGIYSENTEEIHGLSPA